MDVVFMVYFNTDNFVVVVFGAFVFYFVNHLKQVSGEVAYPFSKNNNE